MNPGSVLFFCLTTSACSTLGGSPGFKDLIVFLKQNPPIEDIIINNKIIMRGKAHEIDNDRYDIIKNIVSRYRRPVTVADLDARWGYFSFRLAHDFDALCVMLTHEKQHAESSNAGDNNGDCPPAFSHKNALEQLCLFNTHLTKIVLLGTEPDPTALVRLGTCEHFDIVLARDLLYDPTMAPETWENTADAILAIGETIIIELSSAVIGSVMHVPIIEYIIEHKGERIDLVGKENAPASVFYLISRSKISVADCCLKARLKKYEPHTITSTPYVKFFSKDGIDRPWYPGINIMTFRALDGLFPTDDIIFEQLEKGIPWAQKHSNLLIQGRQLAVLP